jgi:hypothetical protein
MGRGRSRLKSRRKGKMVDVCSFRVERMIGMLGHHELSWAGLQCSCNILELYIAYLWKAMKYATWTGYNGPQTTEDA